MVSPGKNSLVGVEINARYFVASHVRELQYGDLYLGRDNIANQVVMLFLASEEGDDSFSLTAEEDYPFPWQMARGIPGYAAVLEVATWQDRRLVVCEVLRGRFLTDKLDSQGIVPLPEATRMVVAVGLVISSLEELGFAVPYLFEEALIVTSDGELGVLPMQLWPPLALIDTDAVANGTVYVGKSYLDEFEANVHQAEEMLSSLLHHLLVGVPQAHGATFEQSLGAIRKGTWKRLQAYDLAIPSAVDEFLLRRSLPRSAELHRPIGEFLLALVETVESVLPEKDRPVITSEERFILSERARQQRSLTMSQPMDTPFASDDEPERPNLMEHLRAMVASVPRDLVIGGAIAAVMAALLVSAAILLLSKVPG